MRWHVWSVDGFLLFAGSYYAANRFAAICGLSPLLVVRATR
jgi:hypothetical protein